MPAATFPPLARLIARLSEVKCHSEDWLYQFTETQHAPPLGRNRGRNGEVWGLTLVTLSQTGREAGREGRNRKAELFSQKSRALRCAPGGGKSKCHFLAGLVKENTAD